MRKLFVTLLLTCALAVGATAPVAASQPVVTGGLVNITVVDVANNLLRDADVGVAAALAIAANVCDVSVAVLAAQLGADEATCTNDVSGTTATISQPD
jgi:hypothetical protein